MAVAHSTKARVFLCYANLLPGALSRDHERACFRPQLGGG